MGVYSLELSPQQLRKSAFETARDSEFLVREETSPALACVLKLTELRSRPAPPGYEQFAMLFAGPVTPLLPQGTYVFKHEQLGELPLFMVPIALGETGAQYEVCIARSTADD
jgi:hypothetical protein